MMGALSIDALTHHGPGKTRTSHRNRSGMRRGMMRGKLFLAVSGREGLDEYELTCDECHANEYPEEDE